MDLNNQTVKIVVACHKKYQMPSDEMYLPLHVGAEGKVDSKGKPLNLGYVKDNTGDNISKLNSSFCELTGLYWAWKNLDADYIGLVHYRRYFSMKRKNYSFDNVLKYEELKPYLGKVKVFLPTKRRYFIETLYSHYEHTHYAYQLDITRDVIQNKYPEYLECFDKVMKHTSAYMFNMMIMQKDYLDQYCSWLFDILFEVGNRVDTSYISAFQGRYQGRISEIIFNVWIMYQRQEGNLKKEECKVLPCIKMEHIKWWKKGTSFLKAKFFHKKYEGSF